MVEEPASGWLGSRIQMVVELRITHNPQQYGGKPCMRGMRLRVGDVLEMLPAGAPEADLLSDFPDFEAEDIRACMRYAASRADLARLMARPSGSTPSLHADSPHGCR